MAPKRKETTKSKAGGRRRNAQGSKKRSPKPAEPSLDEQIATYKQDIDNVFGSNSFIGPEYAHAPHVVRDRVNKLFDSGIMTKAEFCRAVRTNSVTLNRFLSPMPGTTMCGNGRKSIWLRASLWFEQREKAGLKMPGVKERQGEVRETDAAITAGADSSSSPPTSSAKKGRAAAGNHGLPDISHIYLNHEDDDEVPIYDTCDEVRRKINAHLRKTPGLTEAEFRRTLFSQLHKTKAKGIHPKQMSDFRCTQGSRAGIKSSVYYTAYVYFEKLRLAQGKPESAHREMMEQIYFPRGINRDVNPRTQFLGAVNTGIYFDKFGRTVPFYL